MFLLVLGIHPKCRRRASGSRRLAVLRECGGAEVRVPLRGDTINKLINLVNDQAFVCRWHGSEEFQRWYYRTGVEQEMRWGSFCLRCC